MIRGTRHFHERKQEVSCTVCRDRDPNRLHDPDCPIYELHGAWEEALLPVAREAQADAGDADPTSDGELRDVAVALHAALLLHCPKGSVLP